MRLNAFIATATGISRRAADKTIAGGRVSVNQTNAHLGQQVSEDDIVTLDSTRITLPVTTTTIMLNKPVSYVCSRKGQGSPTIYQLLPPALRPLKPIGRLDKDSSGLLLLTNDGQQANLLMHPRFHKTKSYYITLHSSLTTLDEEHITKSGIKLADGLSRLQLTPLGNDRTKWQVNMQEGRNRQIRRTFAALGYNINQLHRVRFGSYKLGNLKTGNYTVV